jgi:hypothetical protein
MRTSTCGESLPGGAELPGSEMCRRCTIQEARQVQRKNSNGDNQSIPSRLELITSPKKVSDPPKGHEVQNIKSTNPFVHVGWHMHGSCRSILVANRTPGADWREGEEVGDHPMVELPLRPAPRLAIIRDVYATCTVLIHPLIQRCPLVECVHMKWVVTKCIGAP